MPHELVQLVTGIKYPFLATYLNVNENDVVSTLYNAEPAAAAAADALGATTKEVPPERLILFARSFERAYMIPFAQRPELAHLHVKHVIDALMGAMIATYQFNKNFGGETPGSGEFGMQPPRAAWIGIGNDWDTQPVLVGGAFTNWVHSGTSFMAGTAGNDVMCGPNAVHVYIGMGDQAPAPKVESLEMRLDGSILPGFVTGYQMKFATAGPLQVKEFDNILLLKNTTTFRTRLWSNDSGTTIPYFLGFDFLPEDKMRNFINPANLVGTTQNVILTQ